MFITSCIILFLIVTTQTLLKPWMAAAIATVSFTLVLSGVALLVENPTLDAIAFGALTGVGFSVGLFLSIVIYFNVGYFLEKRNKANGA